MDPKMIEINNLRLLNDYLNQTIEVLCRTPRFAGQMGLTGQVGQVGQFGTTGWGGSYTHTHTPFGTAFGTGTDVYGQFPGTASFGGGFGTSPFTAQPQGFGGFYPTGFGPWQGSWGGGMTDTRQLTQAIVAKQSVLEAMCRACGIPV